MTKEGFKQENEKTVSGFRLETVFPVDRSCAKMRREADLPPLPG